MSEQKDSKETTSTENTITYYSKDSTDTDISLMPYVKAYVFNGYVEATAYTRKRFKRSITTIKRKESKLKVKKSVNRTDNIKSMKRSQKRLILLLYNNFLGCKFVSQAVLTYAVKVFDINQSHKDLSKLREKLKYRFPNMAYVAVYEFHKDTSVHIHLIFKNAKGINREILQKLWGKGFVYLKQFNTNAIPYFCKSQRLDLYPAGSRLYSKSINVKMPVPIETDERGLRHIVEDMKCVSKVAKNLYMKDGQEEKLLNHFVYMKFKKDEEV